MLALALTAATCTAKPFPDATWNARPTAPAWLSQPDLVLDVRWFRNASSPAFLFAGVCQLFMRDDAGERDLRAGAPAQVGACARQAAFQKVSLPVGVPAADVRRIQFHFTDTPGVGRMYGELVDEPPAPAIVHPQALRGFYYEAPGGTCVVVVDREYDSLGHEIKHCFDGAFHSKPHQ